MLIDTNSNSDWPFLGFFLFTYLKVGIYFDDTKQDSLPTIRWQFIFELKV